ncbi:hypothetical protein [Actinoallomurus sp. NPDC050550]|uniref:hypothetical protein n=1 Tax=Actinoallomurus sp. NPDC050550 TaxID=3154937 RepID=UPI0033F5E1D3
MSHKLPLAADQVARTATARVLLRGGVDEKTGEALTARTVAERVGWAVDLVAGMTAGCTPIWRSPTPSPKPNARVTRRRWAWTRA